MLGVKSATGLVDATVKVVDVASKKVVANGRTYTSDKNNPKKFILSTGDYEVIITGIKDYAGKSETFKMKVKEGETFEKMVNF